MQTEDGHTIIMSEVMTPDKANFAGNIHGGHLLELLDRVAYACAARYAQKYVVTLSVDQVLFKEPIHVGELVTCYACINYVGHTSMEVGIKVVAENLTSGSKRHTNSCYFTMVAMDENRKPVTVKPLELSTATAKRRFAEAKLRKEMRQKIAEEHARRKTELMAQFKE
jgi:acyl-CoA hydrolase